MDPSSVASSSTVGASASAPPWSLIALGTTRALGTAAAMVAAYYLLPLGHRSDAYIVVELTLGLVFLGALIVWHLRAILRSQYPGIRAAEALATVATLMLLLFAATYFVFSLDDPTTFSQRLTRSDAIYFTVTTFATVGFGDISAQQEAPRMVVTAQMILDLVVLGLGVRVLLGAVERSRMTPDDP